MWLVRVVGVVAEVDVDEVVVGGGRESGSVDGMVARRDSSCCFPFVWREKLVLVFCGCRGSVSFGCEAAPVWCLFRGFEIQSNVKAIVVANEYSAMS